MKLTLRIIISLFIGISLVVVVFSAIQIKDEKNRLQADLVRRSIIVAESLKESIVTLIETGQIERLNRIVEKFDNRERLKGIAVYDASGNIISLTSNLQASLSKTPVEVVNTIVDKLPSLKILKLDNEKIYIYVIPLFSESTTEEKLIGALALFQDASYIDIRIKDIWKQNIIRLLALTLSIVAISI